MWGKGFLSIFFSSLICVLPAAAAEKIVVLEFYNSEILIEYDDAVDVNSARVLTDHAPANFYNDLSKQPYKPMLHSLLQHKKNLQLNDWLFYQLTKQATDKIFGRYNKNERTLATWFFMTKAGYRAKMLFNSGNAYIFVHTEQMVLEMPFIETAEGRFINITSYTDKTALSLSTLYDAESGYNKNAVSFSFDIEKLPDFLQYDETGKTLRFEHNGKAYSVNVRSEKNVLRYLRNYPKLEPDAWTKTPLSETAYASLIPAFKKFTTEMSQDETVKFILSFTRQAFAYATDREAYNEDNIAFAPELTLFSSYSDCEDRAILFAYMIKELLGIDAILLEYPTHVSAAVNLPVAYGKPVFHNGKAYTFCEPTGPQNHLGLGEYPPKIETSGYKIMQSAQR